jgi:hypothetical protein
VNDRSVLDETEERLRRTFERRAEDMASGDGADWDPTWVGLVPAPTTERRPWRPNRRVLVAAVTVMTVPAAVGVGVLALRDRGDDPVRPAGPTAGATTPDPGVPDTSVPVTSVPGATLPSTPTLPACSGRAPDGEDPNRRALANYIKPEQDPEGRPIQVSIDQFTDTGFAGYPGAEPVQAGDHEGWYFTMEGSGGYVTAIYLTVDELAVSLQGRGVTRDELLAVAASVRRGADGTIEHTPPPGFDPIC